jgi:hypothetical protein
MSDDILFDPVGRERVQKQNIFIHSITREIIEIKYKYRIFKEKFGLLFVIYVQN